MFGSILVKIIRRGKIRNYALLSRFGNLVYEKGKGQAGGKRGWYLPPISGHSKPTEINVILTLLGVNFQN